MSKFLNFARDLDDQETLTAQEKMTSALDEFEFPEVLTTIATWNRELFEDPDVDNETLTGYANEVW
jgi:hypothetical protein